MTHVFLLSYEIPINEEDSEVKIIGVYSALENAEKALLEYQKCDKFKDYSERFYIGKWESSIDFWSAGYVTVTL